MTKIKICGLSRIEDVEAVNLYKPDYTGFVFAKSKRQVTKEEAKNLISRLDINIKAVGVFVNETIDNITFIADYAGLDVIQLHGDEDEEFISRLKSKTHLEIWKAIRIKDCEVKRFSVRLLVDTYNNKNFGGSGECFKWELLEGYDKENIILAGGLNSKNILNALKTVSPYMVDVSSGVETNGFKDKEKIREIISLVKGEKNE